MKRWLKWGIPLLALLLIGGFAARTLSARKAQAAARAPSAARVQVIELTAADVLTVAPRLLARTLPVSGGLRAVDSAFVKARVAGELQSLLVREGDTVKAGQRIGQLDPAELQWRLKQAEQTAVSTRTQYDIARRALENNRALVAQGFISPTGLETSVSNEAGARASYEATTAAVELARKALADATLTSPIAGVVAQRLAQPGERVAVDAKVIEVVDLSRIELEAALAPEDVGGVRTGQTATLSVDGLDAPATARVVRINPSAQAGSRAVTVYLAVQGQAGLRQGLFARGAIDLQRRAALVVPLSAVRVDQAQPYVLAVVDGKVAQRTVTLGARGEAGFDAPVGGHPNDGGPAAAPAAAESAVEITAGIGAGAVVLRGSVGALRDGTAVSLPARAPLAGPANATPANAAAASASAS